MLSNWYLLSEWPKEKADYFISQKSKWKHLEYLIKQRSERNTCCVGNILFVECLCTKKQTAELCRIQTKKQILVFSFNRFTIFLFNHVKQQYTVFFFYWSIIYLQCWVNFCYTAKWLSFIYIHTFFIFFSIMVYLRILNIVPCAIQSDLVVHSFYINSFHVLIPNSQSIARSPHIPLGNRKSALCLWVCSCFVGRFICVIF